MPPGRRGSVKSTRRTLIVAASVLVVVALAIAMVNARRSEDRFCSADGRLGPNGQIYGRDPNQGCKFVDESGEVLPGQG
jgi:hypothetical protein